jgi:hypothetical protein
MKVKNAMTQMIAIALIRDLPSLVEFESLVSSSVNVASSSISYTLGEGVGGQQLVGEIKNEKKYT